MHYTYKTKGTCSTQIDLDLEGNVLKHVTFTNGCNGNLKAISSLVEGLTVEEVEEKLKGITCGFKSTSCGDQLAQACLAALEVQKKNHNRTKNVPWHIPAPAAVACDIYLVRCSAHPRGAFFTLQESNSL